MSRHLFWFLLFAVSVCLAGSDDQDTIRLLRIVPPEIYALAQASHHCQPPAVSFTRADFDRDGSFPYVVASYSVVCDGRVTSAVRVLKEGDRKFRVYQILPDLWLRAGELLRPKIIDPENGGVPQLMLRAWKGSAPAKDYSLLLFAWKDGALQPIPIRHIDTRGAVFRDLDADGGMELVAAPRCPAPKVQQSSGEQGSAAMRSESAPVTGCSAPDAYLYRSGEWKQIRIQRSEVQLSRLQVSDKEFSLAEVRNPAEIPETQTDFVVQLELRHDLSNSPVTEIRPETLLLARSLHPLKVIIRSDDQDCKNAGHSASPHLAPAPCLEESLEAHFDRRALAESLPKLQLAKKLEAGDQVSVPLAALMENGDYISSNINVIVSVSGKEGAGSSGAGLQEDTDSLSVNRSAPLPPEQERSERRATGTNFVPIDSWVYSAFDRLAALGYLPDAIMGLRPWTRDECTRLVEEAGTGMTTLHPDPSVLSLYRSLVQEFQPEIEGIGQLTDTRVEQLYARLGFISGQPLADDYHFAKTVADDFGRPFGHGANAIYGGASRTVVGPFSFYVQGEYQHGGTLAPQSTSTLQAIAAVDETPFAVPQRTDSVDRFRLLETYASFEFHKNLVSFGKQTLWWGPGGDAPFLFSNNAEPIPMLRISRVSPFKLPWLFRLMGPIRFEFMWGRLDGQNFSALLDSAGNRTVITPPLNPHPYVDGEKLSFQPTHNLEFGFGVTTVFSGPGFPLTLHSLLRTYSLSNTTPGASGDPGDRRSAFDFSYRLPGLRNWLTLYTDSFTEDEFSPIAYPRKSAFRSGIYMPRLPRLPKIDLRVEGIYTDLPNLRGTGVAYFNTHYLSGYTNYGQIIGSWIGREGRGISAWSSYHFDARNNIQLHYRNEQVNPAFLEGGHVQDFDISGTLVRKHGLVLGGLLQYEHWTFPLLSAKATTDVRVGVQVSFQPLQGWKLAGK